jgi:hypothetical protein
MDKDSNRRRVATRGDELIRGVGVVSDDNGPYRLRFRIDGVGQPITLNTRDWTVLWEDSYDAALAAEGSE